MVKIPLGVTRCIVCDFPGGTLMVDGKPRQVEHRGWVCHLPAGPVDLTASFTLPKVVERPVPPPDPYREKRLLRRRQLRDARLARRKLICGRLVAVDVPASQHGHIRIYSEHGCQCEPCMKACRDYDRARNRKRTAA